MKFKQEYIQENNIWTDWIQPVMTNYHIRCCDCGLVHTINFRVLKNLNKKECEILNKKDYIVQYKIRRNKKYSK